MTEASSIIWECPQPLPECEPVGADQIWLASVGLTPEWFFSCSQRDHQAEVLRNAAALIERQAAELRQVRLDWADDSNEAVIEIDRLKAEIARLREALRECADELEGYIKNEYPEATRRLYPSVQKKFERDMSTVREARTALASEGK